MGEEVKPDSGITPDGGGQEAQHEESAPAGAETKATDKKPTFSEDQQQVVDRLIDRMFGKGFERAKADYEPKLTEAQQTIAKLTEQLNGMKAQQEPQVKADEEKAEKKVEKKSAARDEDIQKVLAKVEELESVARAMKEDRDRAMSELSEVKSKQKDTFVKEAFFAAAKDIQFFDPTDVFELVKRDLVLDEEGAVVVLNPKTGQPRLNPSTYENMSVADYLADFAKSKPHMVRSSTSDFGTGSAQTRRMAKSVQKNVQDMTAEEFEAFRSSILARQ